MSGRTAGPSRTLLAAPFLIFVLHLGSVTTLGTSAAGSLASNTLQAAAGAVAALASLAAARRSEGFVRSFWTLVGAAFERMIPLAARTTWRVDQPRVIQRELRGYLTRTIAREVRNSPDKLTASIVVQQANYDPLGRNLSAILPILSFHSHVGGASYTGLSNDVLADYDLTPLMELDRWLEPYRREWKQRLDSLDRHLAATTPKKERR